MTKLLFEFEFDEKELGEGWMNIYNLELCLYSKEHTRKDLLKVKEIPLNFPISEARKVNDYHGERLA